MKLRIDETESGQDVCRIVDDDDEGMTFASVYAKVNNSGQFIYGSAAKRARTIIARLNAANIK